MYLNKPKYLIISSKPCLILIFCCWKNGFSDYLCASVLSTLVKVSFAASSMCSMSMLVCTMHFSASLLTCTQKFEIGQIYFKYQ